MTQNESKEIINDIITITAKLGVIRAEINRGSFNSKAIGLKEDIKNLEEVVEEIGRCYFRGHWKNGNLWDGA